LQDRDGGIAGISCRHLERRRYVAFGNATGDQQMLEYNGAADNPWPTFDSG
jgi:hypothetical protein